MPGSTVPWLFEEEHLVRSVDIANEPWFVGLDVCKVLGVRDHKQALERLDPDELGRYTVPPQVGDDQEPCHKGWVSANCPSPTSTRS